MGFLGIAGCELAPVYVQCPVLMPLGGQALEIAPLLLSGDITDDSLFGFEVICKFLGFKLF